MVHFGGMTTTIATWVERLGRTKPWVLVAAVVVVLLTVWIQFTGLTDRPTGFYLDESSYSYNAWTIAQHGVDEHGVAWPVIFEAFPGDWKGPFVYVLAAVFKLAGPSILAVSLARVVLAQAAHLAAQPLAALAAGAVHFLPTAEASR